MKGQQPPNGTGRLQIKRQPAAPEPRQSRQTGDARLDFERVADGRIDKLVEASLNLANVCKVNRELMTPEDWEVVIGVHNDAIDSLVMIRDHGSPTRRRLGS